MPDDTTEKSFLLVLVAIAAFLLLVLMVMNRHDTPTSLSSHKEELANKQHAQTFPATASKPPLQHHTFAPTAVGPLDAKQPSSSTQLAMISMGPKANMPITFTCSSTGSCSTRCFDPDFNELCNVLDLPIQLPRPDLKCDKPVETSFSGRDELLPPLYIQKCTNYTQYTVQVSNNMGEPRVAFFAVPNVQPPTLGFPFVLVFGVTQESTSAGGVQPDAAGLEQNMMMSLLANGIAVVITTASRYDVWNYAPDGEPFYSYYCNEASSLGFCWQEGDNPDAVYLSELLNYIYGPAQPAELYFSLNTTQMGVLGFHVGCAMASRAINSFPSFRSSRQFSFPAITAVVMLHGGSMYCYAYEPFTDPPSIPFSNCDYAPVKKYSQYGCCPSGMTETIYAVGIQPYDQHPPTLLVNDDTPEMQTGDKLAAMKYYSTLTSNKVPGQCLVTYDSTEFKDLDKMHEIIQSVSTRIVNFIAYNMHLSPFSSATSNRNPSLPSGNLSKPPTTVPA